MLNIANKTTGILCMKQASTKLDGVPRDLLYFQSIALCGTASALVFLSYTSTYGSALVLMAIAVMCCGFHNSGILVNPQDIAPSHAGSVFGKQSFLEI